MHITIKIVSEWGSWRGLYWLRLCKATMESYKKCFIVSQILNIFAYKTVAHQQTFEEYSIFH